MRSAQRKLAILANAHAGQGAAAAAVRRARQTLWGWGIDSFLPENFDSFQNVCRLLTPERYEGALIVGGDGTFHHALRILEKRDLPLYPFPTGTANDLASELELKPDWEQAQTLIDSQSIERIDLLRANGIPFSTIAGLGVGAIPTEEYNLRRQSSPLFQKISRQFESQIYSALCAKALVSSSSYIHRLRFESPGFNETLRTPAVFICNQSTLGSNFTVCPPTSNNDGKFTVTIVPRTSIPRLLHGLMSLQLGTLPADFIIFSTDRLKVVDLDGREIPIFADGEVILKTPEVQFELSHEALPVYSARAIFSVRDDHRSKKETKVAQKTEGAAG